PLPLVQLHITLLRRVFKAVTPDKWERSLAKFGHTYCSQDAWEIERFGYKKAKISLKLRLLKNLLEAQFDYNVKFKSEVNKLQAADLRLTPLGRDTEGQVYWYQVDADANLRVYREDIDDETWEMVASSKDELVDLISQLQRGEVKKPEPEEAIIVPEEDSNGKDIEPKEIILDTGKVEEDGSMGEESEE
ncbi:Remodeling and spacing factor 1, partial [Orchesella cincta]